jgi:tetratricopeptide (TPR) repeat protein
MTSGRRHPTQTLASQTQKRRSLLRSLGLAIVRLYTASCWRKARFSRARWRWLPQRTGRSRTRWIRRVIIEPGLSPDQSPRDQPLAPRTRLWRRTAILPLERAVEVCRVAQVRLPFDIAAGHLGYAYALVGRLPEGVSFLEEALADPAATGTTNHPLLLAYLGEAHLLAGRREDALELARRALELAHRQKERGNEAWVLRLLGEIAAHADPPDPESARARFTQALARAEELGMCPLVAHCRLGLGRLYQRTDKREQAHEHLTTATTMYREMDMRFWLEKAEKAMSESAGG